MRNGKPGILILIVLYKRAISESETFKSLRDQDISNADLSVVVWDNSPIPIPNGELAELKTRYPQSKYISTPENVWLSKVYNTVVASNTFDYILLLDQDTEIPGNYFTETIKVIKSHPDIPLIMPIVKNGDRIVSPADFWIFKGKHWNLPKTGLIGSKNVIGITSGLLIAHHYFLKYGYKFDERLSLYGIDSKFMLDYSKNEPLVFVLPVEYKQNSALWSNPSADALLPRFVNLRSAWITILSQNLLTKSLAITYGMYNSVKLAVRYKDIRFLKSISSIFN